MYPQEEKFLKLLNRYKIQTHISPFKERINQILCPHSQWYFSGLNMQDSAKINLYNMSEVMGSVK